MEKITEIVLTYDDGRVVTVRPEVFASFDVTWPARIIPEDQLPPPPEEIYLNRSGEPVPELGDDDDDEEKIDPAVKAWMDQEPKDMEYTIVPGGHTTQTLKDVIGWMFSEGPLRRWLFDQQEWADEPDFQRGIDASNVLADPKTWIRTRKMRAKNMPPYKESFLALCAPPDNVRVAFRKPDMPHDDSMIVRVFQPLSAAYNALEVDRPFGLQLVVFTTPNDDQVVGVALEEL